MLKLINISRFPHDFLNFQWNFHLMTLKNPPESVLWRSYCVLNIKCVLDKFKHFTIPSKFFSHLQYVLLGWVSNKTLFIYPQGTNFVRCIKPNSRMVGSETEGSLVLTQLECSGTIAVLELMEHGYPSRAPFNDLHQMYKGYLPAKLQSLPAKTFCEVGSYSYYLSCVVNYMPMGQKYSQVKSNVWKEEKSCSSGQLECSE